MSKMYLPIWKAVSGTPVARGERGMAKVQRRGQAVLASIVAAVTLIGTPGAAQAASVSVCTGVSLPPSTITTMLNPLVTPLAGALPTLGLNTIWAGIAAGAPVRLNVLDTAGNPVLSTAVCDATADSYALNTPKGISIGGNKITGLGITTVANAGETGSVALGNGAVTNAAATNSIALGTNASVGAAGANSVALGAGSAANTGAQVAYAAFGLATPRTSVGEVSVGATGSLRKFTNLAPGSALTDAVNVEQLQAVDNGAVKYDIPALKLTVTLGGVGGTRISNLAPGVAGTDAVNVNQLQAAVKAAYADDNHHRDKPDDNHYRDQHGNQNDLEREVRVLMQQIHGLQEQVATLQTQLTDLHTQLGSIEAIAPHVSLETVNGHDTVRFSSVNLQVVNGVGSTPSANGLGNLIIGYDEADTSGLYHCTIGTNPTTLRPVTNETDCVAAGGEWLNTGFKSGSHYLVLGMQNNYSRWGALIVGRYNTSNFDFASVSGGAVNTSSGTYSSVSGGFQNTASGYNSSVSGGVVNTASGSSSSVSGGHHNTASGSYSSVSGAGGNTTGGNGSSVTGGGGNTTSGD